MDGITSLAAAAGIPAGQLRFLAALFAAPLLCAAHGLLPGPTLRHATSAVFGGAMCVFAFGVQSCVHMVLPFAASVLVLALFPRRAGPITFLICFSYLIYCHVASGSANAWKEGQIDYTGTLMVLVLKLISTAFDVGDGAKSGATLTAHQAACALPQRPSLLALTSYVLYPGMMLANPWMPFAEYNAFICRTGPWAPTAPRRPSALLPTARRVALGVLCAALHAKLAPALPETVFLDEQWVSSHSVPAKVAYMHAMAFATRCKYYFVWLLADAACCAGGLGWSGYEEPASSADGDGKSQSKASKAVAKWERTRNIDPLGVELAVSAASFPHTWNISTSTWLRFYCYERLMQPPAALPPFVAMLLTQATSGLWHGLHAGYWLFFVGSGFMFQASKVIFRYQRAIPARYTLLRRAVALLHWAISAFHLNYLAAAFIAISLPAGRAAFASVHYAGHFTMAALCLLGAVLPSPRGPKRSEAPSGAAARKRD